MEKFYFSQNNLNLGIFKGNTLIIPAVSVGNVGQLACDLIISTLQLEKVGYFCPQCFLPLNANNPFATSIENSNILSLNTEVYNDIDRKVTLLQVRSPLVKGKRDFFCKKLLEWMEECEFNDLVILSSCHAFERTDEQLTGLPFRYLLSPRMSNLKEKFKEFKWRELETRKVGFGDKTIFLPGAGLTKTLYKYCCDDDISAAVLLLFCSEGNNIPEAMSLASYVNQWKSYINEITGRWNPPASWTNLFGNTPPSDIF